MKANFKKVIRIQNLKKTNISPTMRELRKRCLSFNEDSTQEKPKIRSSKLPCLNSPPP